jgi:hypothetical protein
VTSPSTFPTAFDCHGIERLAEWKKFRDYLEVCEQPYHTLIEYWIKAPTVSEYLDPHDIASWPDPWKLILDLKLDNLAIVLGMLYTLKLTKRFMDSKFEIHMTIPKNRTEADYFLSIADHCTLDHQMRSVEPYRTDVCKIWCSQDYQ